MKQVPEGKTVLRGQQFDRLFQKLAGHKVFGRRRGKLGFMTETLANIADKADTPTAFLNELNGLFSDARVLADFYAQLRRDGCDEAAEELLRALGDKGHVLPGETVPIEKTKKCVLVMFAPEKTLRLLEFMHSDGMGIYLRYVSVCHRHFIHGETVPGLNSLSTIGGSVPDTLAILQETIPSIWKYALPVEHSVNCFDADISHELPFLAAYIEDIFAKCVRKEARQLFYYSRLKPLAVCNRFDLLKLEGIRPKELERIYLTSCGGFAFWAEGDIADVRSLFTRDEQDDMAFWEFALPAVIDESRNPLRVVLFKEEEYERWKRERPAFVSKSVTHGYGVLRFPYANFFSDYSSKPGRFILR